MAVGARDVRRQALGAEAAATKLRRLADAADEAVTALRAGRTQLQAPQRREPPPLTPIASNSEMEAAD